MLRFLGNSGGPVRTAALRAWPEWSRTVLKKALKAGGWQPGGVFCLYTI